jgi:hypothetical protein
MVYQVAGYPIPRHGPWIRQEVSEPVRGWRTGRAREGERGERGGTRSSCQLRQFRECCCNGIWIWRPRRPCERLLMPSRRLVSCVGRNHGAKVSGDSGVWSHLMQVGNACVKLDTVTVKLLWRDIRYSSYYYSARHPPHHKSIYANTGTIFFSLVVSALWK